MVPTNDTVVRFIAVYGNGFSQHPTKLILGYGYQRFGGLDHQQLVGQYGIVGEKYAGYLTLDGDRVKVFKGGSATLFILPDEDLNGRLEFHLNALSSYKQAIHRLFPLLISKKVAHELIEP